MKVKRILFLCTGNSCRSQMAEGLARHLGEGKVEVLSAGVTPAGFVNPRAVESMREIGIDISRQTSKALDPQLLNTLDLLVTVCGHAEAACPAAPAGVRHLHWPIPDPFHAGGSEEEIKRQFRAIRDDLQARIAALLTIPPPSRGGG